MKRIYLLYLVLFSFHFAVFSDDIPFLIQPFGWTCGYGYDLKLLLPEVIDDYLSTVEINDEDISFSKEYYSTSSNSTLEGPFRVFLKNERSSLLKETENSFVIERKDRILCFILLGNLDLKVDLSENIVQFERDSIGLFFAPHSIHAEKFDMPQGGSFFELNGMLNDNLDISLSKFIIFDTTRTEYKIGEIMGIYQFPNYELEILGDNLYGKELIPIYIYKEGFNSYKYLMRKNTDPK